MVVFDTDEKPLVDIHTPCDCVRTASHISDSGSPNLLGQFGISSIYKSARAFASGGTFTKLETDPVSPGLPFPFTGYRSTASGALNDFFGRMSNGGSSTIDGRIPSGTIFNLR